MIGHLTGSYDAGGTYGLEQLELVGSKGRIVLDEACEVLTYYDRTSPQTETFVNLGGMTAFGQTFQSRVNDWVGQLKAGVAAEDVNASGADGLHVRRSSRPPSAASKAMRWWICRGRDEGVGIRERQRNAARAYVTRWR